MSASPSLPRITRSSTKRGWAHALVVVGYLLLTVVMTWPLVMQFTMAIPGDGFDGWQNYWNLWWVKVALVDRIQNPYVTDLLYFPTGVTLYFHTLNPFNGVVTLPVQLTAGLIAAYNAVVLISWTLAGYGMWLLARWVIARKVRTPRTWGDVAAFGAGVIYAFAPVHMAHLLGHMQVMALQWLPFYVLALLRSMARARAGLGWRRDAVMAGLFLTLAGLCDWYFVLYLFLFTLVVIVGHGVAAMRSSRGKWRGWWAATAPAAVAGVLFALLLSPVLAPMVYEATQFSFMVRPSTDLYTFSASALDFVLPSRMHTLVRPDGLGTLGNQVAPISERTVAVGYAALALAVVALVKVRRAVAWWGVAAVVFALLALGPRMHLWQITWEDIPTPPPLSQEWSPYGVVNTLVPFMRISRSVSRFAIVVQIAVAVLASVGLAWWLQRVHGRVRIGVAVGVMALMLAEYWVAPYPMTPPDTPPYYATAGNDAGAGAILNLPMNYDRPGYLLYQTIHQRPLTVAYISRDDPRTLTERVPLLQHWRHLGPDILEVDAVQVGMTVLADLGVETVTLDRYKMPGGEEREYTEALAAAVFADATPEYSDERLTVYAVLPPDVPQPYLELGPLGWGPLMTADDGQMREVGVEGADLLLHHVANGASITIDYQSMADGTVTSADGLKWVLPAAPEGNSLTFAVEAGVMRVTVAATEGEVRVRRVALQVDGE